MRRFVFRVGDVIRSREMLEPYYRVDPNHAQGDDRVVIEVSDRGLERRVDVVTFREWLDWRIGADL